MKKIFLLALSLSVFCSCNFRIPSRIKKNFTYRNEGQYTGLDTLINIHGIYYTSEIRSHGYNPVEIDTFYTTLMFWNDGTAKRNIWNPREIQSYFDEILLKIENKHTHYFYNGLWGSYRIIGDTVKIQYIWIPEFYNLNDSWNGFSECFKIIDTNTLEYLPLLTQDMIPSKNKHTIKIRQQFLEAQKGKKIAFFPVERIPPPNCELKKKKWFWCNEEDWKAYKEKAKNGIPK